MKSIKFLGAAGTVTGSSFLLTHNTGTNVLIDFGMFQGPKRISQMNYDDIAMNIPDISAIVLTHAHLDHCGRLPILIKNGFTGPIYMTEPTRALLALALFDAAKIAKFDEDIIPMYEKEDVERVLDHAHLVEYGDFFTIGPYHIILRDAGHILGSASVEIHDSLPRDTIKTIVFSGDLGNTPEPLVRPTEYIRHADIVVMESTYGDREHAHENPVAILAEETQVIEQSGGTLLIPSFSIERAQELLHIFDHLKKEGKVHAETRVFLDSPMAVKATGIYKKFKECYSRELAHHAMSDDPFHFPGLHLVDSGRESRKIEKITNPKVIIAGAGMMTGGRILHHAARYLPEETTRLLFVGFQGEETLGREILEGAKTVRIEEKQVVIRAHVRKSSGMSSHADQGTLLEWLQHIKDVQRVFLIHGEDTGRESLAHLIKDRLQIHDVVLPTRNEEVKISI